MQAYLCYSHKISSVLVGHNSFKVYGNTCFSAILPSLTKPYLLKERIYGTNSFLSELTTVREGCKMNMEESLPLKMYTFTFNIEIPYKESTVKLLSNFVSTARN